MSLAQRGARLSDVARGVVALANRNLIVDGAFDQWSAANAAPSNAYGPLVMWLASQGTGGAATLSQFDVRTNINGSDSGPKFAFWWQQTTASTGTVAARSAPYLITRLENLARTAGRSVTFSIKLWNNTASPVTIPGLVAAQYFGSGGSPSATIFFDKTVNWTLPPSGAPKRFSVRLDIPSIGGKQLGTNNNDYLTVGIWMPPGVTFSILGIEAQLELCSPYSSSDINGAGGEPTTFEYRGEQDEVARMLRFYGAYTTLASTIVGGMTRGFPVPMRAVPALSISSFNAGTGATFIANDAYGFWQNTAHSQIATASLVLDARL